MKKVFILMIIVVCYVLQTDIIEYHLDFEIPQISSEDGYTNIQYDNCQNIGEPGDPSLPLRGIKLLLPAGSEAVMVEIQEITYYPFSEKMRIIPSQEQIPLSEDITEYNLAQESEIYHQDTIYPQSPVRNLVTQYKNGHPIALFTCCPVSYYPARDSVVFVKSIKLMITTEITRRSQAASSLYRHDNLIADKLEKLVDNPERLCMFPESLKRSNRIDILIITSQELSEAFSDYMAYKETCGFKSCLLTTSEIYGEYPGNDEQEKIRNAIINYYQQYDLQYVLLGGDSSPVNAERNIVPHRGFYGLIGGYEDYDIPSDMYYCCLDGNWNDNGDEMWGEYNEADYFEEVSVGRISGASISEISCQLNKLYMYQNAPVVSDLEKCLLIGQIMGPIVSGGEYLEELATGSENWGYSTTGVSENITITRLYEMYFGWEESDLFYNLNSGTNLVNNMGHGSTDHCFKISTSQLNPANICNNGVEHGFYNCYSQACYSGAFDNRTTIPGEYLEESFAEKLTTLATGAASFIANSRYSWYAPVNTNGVSQHYARKFYDAIFGEGIYKIGNANADAKEDNASYLAESRTHRWVYYELNLLGDPTMNIWTSLPLEIDILLPSQLNVGESQIPFQTEDSNLQYAVFMSGEMLGCGHTGLITNQAMLLENPLSEPGMLEVYVNEPNHQQFITQIEVLPIEQEILLQNIVVNDTLGWNINGLADYGEMVSLNFELFNTGTLAASEIGLHINSQDEFIGLKDSILWAGELMPGEILSFNEAFSLVLADNIPDQHSIELFISILIDSVLIRECVYDLVAQAPLLEMGEMTVDDESGNMNGILDIGESVNLAIPVLNAGNSRAEDMTIELFCTNPDICIHNDQIELPELLPHTEETVFFPVTVSSELLSGERIEFIIIAQAEEYNFFEIIPYYIGSLIEDFETGDFSRFDWFSYYPPDWEISNIAREGEYSACSPFMDNYQSSWLAINITTFEDGYISFWVKTRALPWSGSLEFYINHTQQFYWYLQTDWTWVEVFVPAGENEIFWNFHTGPSGGDYHSRAWVDYIVFPPMEYVDVHSGTISDNVLVKNYPNPFNPNTTISYSLLQPAEAVKLRVYNIKGQEIWSYSELNVSSGRQEIYWNGRNADREPVASGIYFYQLSTPGKTYSGKMMLIK